MPCYFTKVVWLIILEVIIAQNNTLQNELDIINIKREKLNATTDLYRALGGGTEN
ncbi:hypothetical protein GCM10027442_45710 [Emticicia fontis]